MRKILLALALSAFSLPALAQQVSTPAITALACAYNSGTQTGISGQFMYVQCDSTGRVMTSGGSAIPSGPAGGALKGTYPNPLLADVNAIATSLSISSATIGTDALGVTGTGSISGMWNAGGINLTATVVPANGLSLPVANTLGFSANSSIRFRMSGTDFFSNTSGGPSIRVNAASATAPTLVPNSSDTTTGIGAQASGNMSMIVGGAEIGRFIAGGFTLISGQLNVAAMTQTAVAQSGTVCYNSGTGAVTYDATLGCLASTMAVKKNWKDIPPREALAAVLQMRAGSFEYIEGMGLPGGEQVGLSAQQIEGVDRRLVGYRPNGELAGVRYQQASALYPMAIQQLKADNDNLRAELRDLQRRVIR